MTSEEREKLFAGAVLAVNLLAHGEQGKVDRPGTAAVVFGALNAFMQHENQMEKGAAVFQQMTDRAIPCGHTIGDLVVQGVRNVTKCAACIARVRAEDAKHEASIEAQRVCVNVDCGEPMHPPVMVNPLTRPTGLAIQVCEACGTGQPSEVTRG